MSVNCHHSSWWLQQVHGWTAERQERMQIKGHFLIEWQETTPMQSVDSSDSIRSIKTVLSSSFRAVSEQFQSQSSFRAISEQFQSQSSFRAVSEQFQSQRSFRAVLEHFQINFRVKAISEQFKSSFRAVSVSKKFQSSFRAVSEQF